MWRNWSPHCVAFRLRRRQVPDTHFPRSTAHCTKPHVANGRIREAPASSRQFGARRAQSLEERAPLFVRGFSGTCVSRSYGSVCVRATVTISIVIIKSVHVHHARTSIRPHSGAHIPDINHRRLLIHSWFDRGARPQPGTPSFIIHTSISPHRNQSPSCPSPHIVPGSAASHCDSESHSRICCACGVPREDRCCEPRINVRHSVQQHRLSTFLHVTTRRTATSTSLHRIAADAMCCRAPRIWRMARLTGDWDAGIHSRHPIVDHRPSTTHTGDSTQNSIFKIRLWPAPGPGDRTARHPMFAAFHVQPQTDLPQSACQITESRNSLRISPLATRSLSGFRTLSDFRTSPLRDAALNTVCFHALQSGTIMAVYNGL